jgi:hypothetical protein
MTSGYFTMSMDRKLTMTSNSAENNSTFSTAGTGSIELVFNMDIALDGITVTTGNTTSTLDSSAYSVNGTYLTIELADLLNAWYADGTIAAGQQFDVKVQGLRSADDATNLYDGTGILDLTYYAAAQPSQLVSATNGDGSVDFTNLNTPGIKFLSYFLPENANGKYVLTFSQPLDPNAGLISLQYGSSESSDSEYYQEYLTPSFNDDYTVMTIDVTGKLRRAQDMLSSGNSYSTILLALNGLRGADGQYIYSNYQGSMGSIFFNFNYEEVVANPYAEFTPMSEFGSADKLNIYISDYATLSYDGIEFAWTANGEDESKLVPMSEITVSTDSFGGASVVVAIPAEAKAQKDVLVSLHNLVVSDGVDHSADLSQLFNPSMKILSSTPADGALLEKFEAGYTFKVKVDRSDLAYMQYEVIDLNAVNDDDAYIISRSGMTAVEGEEATFSAENYFDKKLIKGHNYKMIVMGWTNEAAAQSAYNAPEGKATITFSGLTEPFTFSDTKFVNITPANGTTIKSVDNNNFVVSFSAPVNINKETTFINLGQGNTAEFESITPSVNGEYANNWTLIVAKDFLAQYSGQLTISLKATDLEGKVVEGNQGVEEQSYFQFVYPISISATGGTSAVNIISTPANGDVVDSCDSIDIIFSDYDEAGIGAGKAILSGPNGEVALGDAEYGMAWNEVIQPLYGNAAANGAYTVTFPAGYFILGDGEDSPEFSISFTVGEAVSGLNIQSTPADGDVVDSCDSIDIIFSDYDEAGIGGGKAILSGPNGEVALGDAEYGMAWNEVIQPLYGNAAADGAYTVTFPAGYFILGDGEDSPAFSISFTVNGGAGVASVEISDQTARYYTIQGVEVETPEPGNVYIVVRGNKITKELVK